MEETLDSIIKKIYRFGDSQVKLAILCILVLIAAMSPFVFQLAIGLGAIILAIYFISLISGLSFINKITKLKEITYGLKIIGVGFFLLFIYICLLGYYYTRFGDFSLAVEFKIALTIPIILTGLGFVLLGLGIKKLGSDNNVDLIIFAGILLAIISAIETLLNTISIFAEYHIASWIEGLSFLLSLLFLIIFYEGGEGFKRLAKRLSEFAEKAELIGELNSRVNKKMEQAQIRKIAKEMTVPVLLVQILAFLEVET